MNFQRKSSFECLRSTVLLQIGLLRHLPRSVEHLLEPISKFGHSNQFESLQSFSTLQRLGCSEYS